MINPVATGFRLLLLFRLFLMAWQGFWSRNTWFCRLTLTFLILSWSAAAGAQQIKTGFNIHLETLPINQQEEMRGFDRKLKDYVEGWNWFDDDLPEPVHLNMEAFLAFRGSGAKTQYASKLTVSNGLDIKYLDRWWFFEFQPDDVLQHDDRRFHPLTWLIDYYAHLMIGHEMDKYREFGGDEHFRRAEAICMDARFSREFQKGWDERLEVVRGIMADDYQPYRRIRHLFSQGMALQRAKNNREARIYCRQAIDLLSAQHGKNAKDERIREFMNAHYLELIDVFRTDASPEVYETLRRIDPDHAAAYEEHIQLLKNDG